METYGDSQIRTYRALPGVPIDYPRLAALNPEEIADARRRGYITDLPDVSDDVCRNGEAHWFEDPAGDDIRNWRVRMYAIWFCYFYENFSVMKRPFAAMEELIQVFKGTPITDESEPHLGSLYAGAHAWTDSPENRQYNMNELRPHYKKVLTVLGTWMSERSTR
jgi:hypothetical protein